MKKPVYVWVVYAQSLYPTPFGTTDAGDWELQRVCLSKPTLRKNTDFVKWKCVKTKGESKNDCRNPGGRRRRRREGSGA